VRHWQKRYYRWLARLVWPARTSLSLQGSPADPALQALASGQDITEPVVIISAHPDDETIGVGARLRRLKNLTLIHVTNGAPDRPGANLAGFPNPASYSAARFRELEHALDLLEAQPVQRRLLGFVDGNTVHALDRLVDILTGELRGKAVVMTHAYEGGHPDHDSCAFAVQRACERLLSAGEIAPVRVEHTGYHSYKGEQRTGTFWAGERTSIARIRLNDWERNAKAAAFRAFTSQGWLPTVFRVDREIYRAAPRYDFTQPPAPGAWLYDTFGWEMKGQTWLVCARAATQRLRD